VRDLVRAGFARAGLAVPADLAAAGRAGVGSSVAAGYDPGEALVAADALGRDLERTLSPEERARGAHYTPLDVALGLAERTVDPTGARADAPTVWDPACGGGVFLLAAAEVLRAAGRSPHEIVTHLLWGSDTDPAAIAVTEAALVLWATLHGAPEARPGDHLAVADGLAGPPAGESVAHVLANPPFQGQLRGRSRRSAAERDQLRRRFGDAIGPYTDTAALFLVAATEALAHGGRLAMVLPTSVLASRDAAGARATVEALADLRGLWVAVDPVFEASVDVCAPILERRRPDRRARQRPPIERWRRATFERLPPARSLSAGSSSPRVDDATTVPEGGPSWAALGLAAHDVPIVHPRAEGRLGDLARASAGFRDEYYGLVDHVVERRGAALACGCGDGADDDETCGRHVPLATTGLIDPGRCRWGERPVRFARRTLHEPLVDLHSLRAAAEQGGPAAKAWRWVTSTARPKVVVATQARVGEAAVDAGGRWVASTPALAVFPAEAGILADREPVEALWCIAAAICSPVGSWAALAGSFGSARSAQAAKLHARGVLDLPMPCDPAAWLAGAQALRDHHREPFAAAMAAAYDLSRDEAARLQDWWSARAPW
jgi:hypothetical protein